jgi:flagellar hook-length control protein FliK
LLNAEDPRLAGVKADEGVGEGSLSAFAGTDGRFREAVRGMAQDKPEHAAEGAAAPESARVSQGKGLNPDEAAKKDKPTAAETRNSKKNKERLALEVQDIRTGQNGAALNAGQEPKHGPEAGTERVADITVELKNGGRSRENGEPGQMKSAGQAFGDILARELHQNLNGDIVRQASIMVRDGGEGTIRLSLKPEVLGMVKIRLEMAENKITGHIIVESTEALRAFEKEIHSLEQAFRDSGFEGASLDMALAGDGGQNSGKGQREAAPPLFASRIVSSSYDDMGETIELFSLEDERNWVENSGVSRVNVLA